MKYKLVLVDPNGVRWAYERHMAGEPLFVQEAKAQPKMLTKEEAILIGREHHDEQDRVFVESC